MSKSKIEELWNELIVYDFKIDCESIDRELICVLCKSLLIEAREAACGCRFCKRCIEEFLQINTDRYCPGDSKECEEDQLDMGVNVSVNHVINRRVLKMPIKCPMEFCEFVDELRNMGKHLSNCGERPISCPFSRVGCGCTSLRKEKLANHLREDGCKHTELLLEHVSNLTNESIRNNKQDKGYYKKQLKKYLLNINFVLYFVCTAIFAVVISVYGNRICAGQYRQLQQELQALRNEGRYDQMKQEVEDMKKYCLRDHPGELTWRIEGFTKLGRTILYSDYFHSNSVGHEIRLKMSVKSYSSVSLLLENYYSHYFNFRKGYVIIIGILDPNSWAFATSEIIESSSDKDITLNVSDSNLKNDTLVIKCLASVYLKD